MMNKPPCDDFGQRLAALEAYQYGFKNDLSELKENVKEGFNRLTDQIKNQETRIYKISVVVALFAGGGGLGVGKFLL